jgi:hypothetical protein
MTIRVMIGVATSYIAFNLDTNISKFLAHATNMRPNNGKPDNFLPRDEWYKLTTSQKEALMAEKCTERKNGVDGSRNYLTQPQISG